MKARGATVKPPCCEAAVKHFVSAPLLRGLAGGWPVWLQRPVPSPEPDMGLGQMMRQASPLPGKPALLPPRLHCSRQAPPGLVSFALPTRKPYGTYCQPMYSNINLIQLGVEWRMVSCSACVPACRPAATEQRSSQGSPRGVGWVQQRNSAPPSPAAALLP
jgi:hypothetical protein